MKTAYHRLFLAFSLLYLVLLNMQPMPLAWLLKILPIVVLMVGVSVAKIPSGKGVLILALIFSATGDVLLQQGLFIPGVAAFLIAQLHYSVFFWHQRSSLKQRWPLSLMIIMFMVVMAVLLSPDLGGLAIPVYAYLIVVGTMGLLANQSSLAMKWAVIGAFVFILSDALIAIDRFIMPLPFSGFLIMSTYYGAQWMIIQGALTRLKIN